MWEYLQISKRHGLSNKELNEFGKENWEHYLNMGETSYFKRPLVELPKEMGFEKKTKNESKNRK